MMLQDSLLGTSPSRKKGAMIYSNILHQVSSPSSLPCQYETVAIRAVFAINCKVNNDTPTTSIDSEHVPLKETLTYLMPSKID